MSLRCITEKCATLLPLSPSVSLSPLAPFLPRCERGKLASFREAPLNRANQDTTRVPIHRVNNRYMDNGGVVIPALGSLPSAAAVVHTSDDGVEEMHLFFDLGWYDVGSWAWGHFAVEWGTKGVFQVLVEGDTFERFPCCLIC